jgi:YaiO family outer membrane protein
MHVDPRRTKPWPGSPSAWLAGLLLLGAVGTQELAAQVQVEAGASREVVSGGREDWEEYWIRATIRPAPGTHAYGGFRHTRRFGEEDQQYEAGGGGPAGEWWTVGVDGTWSPTHRVLPRWGARARARRALPDGWGLGFGAGRRVYDEARVDHQHLEVDRSFAPFRVAYRLGFSQVSPGRSGIGHLISGSWAYAAGSSVTVGLGIGREASVLAPDRVETTTFRSASLQGAHRLDDRTAFTYRLTAYRHGDEFTRTSVGFGVRRGL